MEAIHSVVSTASSHFDENKKDLHCYTFAHPLASHQTGSCQTAQHIHYDMKQGRGITCFLVKLSKSTFVEPSALHLAY